MILTAGRPSPHTPRRTVKPSHPLRRGLLVAVEFSLGAGFDYVANRAVTLKARTGGRRGEFGLISDAVGSNGAEYNNPRLGTLNTSSNLTVAWFGVNITGTEQLVTLSDNSYNGLGVKCTKLTINSNGSTILAYTPTTAPTPYVYSQNATAGTCALYANGRATAIASGSLSGLNNVTASRVWFHKNTYSGGSEASAAGCTINRVFIWDRALSAAEAVEWMVNYHLLFCGSANQRNAILSAAPPPSSSLPWMIDGDFPSYGYVEA